MPDHNIRYRNSGVVRQPSVERLVTFSISVPSGAEETSGCMAAGAAMPSEFRQDKVQPGKGQGSKQLPSLKTHPISLPREARFQPMIPAQKPRERLRDTFRSIETLYVYARLEQEDWINPRLTVPDCQMVPGCPEPEIQPCHASRSSWQYSL